MKRLAWLLVAAVACGDNIAAVGPAPLRRLSNLEYRYALTDLFPTVAVELPPLPADTAVAGFENEVQAQQPSDLRIARVEAVANLYASAATKDDAAVRLLTGCASWATPSEAAACSAQFVRTVGARLFRRPLTAEEEDRFLRKLTAWAMSVDFPGAVQLSLSAMLQSPQFLYRPEPPLVLDGTPSGTAPVEPYAMASRLSFFLWESVPDDELLAAAARGELQTVASIREQATRMLADPRAARLIWDFHRQWLALDRILNDEHDYRTPAIDEAWTADTKTSVLQESQLFVEHSFLRVGTLADLLTSRSAWVNAEMARIYGVPAPATADAWAETVLPAEQRAGLLTRAAFLAGTSHRGGTSPPVRGSAILLRMMCRLPAPPPPDADLSMPVQDPRIGPQTNRQLFEDRTSTPACRECHRALNGIGFGFENYNAAGRFVTQEHGLTIDVASRLFGTDIDGAFAGGIEFSAALQRSREVYHCASQQWLRYALGRAATDDEASLIGDLTDQFMASKGDIRRLLLAIVTSNTFRMRIVGSTAGVAP